VLDQEALDVRSAPARGLEDIGVLAREHDQGLVEALEVGRAHVAERVREAEQEGLGVAAS